VRNRGEQRGATFRSLHNRNYRLYFSGQVISMAGTFMQVVAQAWLVVKLTNSGVALGLVSTLQFLPTVLLSPMAGVVIDRHERRRVYVITQALCGFSALLLGLLTMSGHIELWMVYALAAVFGVITAFDHPTKAAIIYDLVGPEDLTNAVSLNMAIANIGRVVGPAMAGLTIGLVGIGPCFLLNAASFAGVIIALVMMQPDAMFSPERQPRAKGQLRQGLAAVRRHREILALLVLATLFFAITWELDIVMPLFASHTFGGSASLYGLFMSTIGGGAFIAALIIAQRSDATPLLLSVSAVGLGVALIAVAMAPTILVAFLLLPVAGGFGSAFIGTLSARLQRIAPLDVRGRVLGLWSIATLGSRPFGAPIVGYVSQHAGPRFGLVLMGAVVIVALGAWAVIRRPTRAVEPAVVDVPALVPAEL
jgi:MFS family permease